MTELNSCAQSAELTRRGSLLLLFSMVLGDKAMAAEGPAAVKVGFLRHYKPFSYRDANGRPLGFDFDVASRVCELLQLRMDPVLDSLEGLAQRVKSGEIAWLGNQLLTTPENRRRFDFVRPAYASIQLSAVQHEDDDRDFLSLEDLLGKRLGVLAGTGVEEQARSVLGKTVKAYEHIENALHDLSHQQLDMVLEENLIADYHIHALRLPLKVAAPFAAPMAVGLGVRKGDREMQEKLSQTLQSMLKDGSLSRISEKWFGYDVSRSRVSHTASH